jgi:ferredoxin-NADP reductase
MERIVFIAGGIGITPLLSMLRYIAQTDSRKSVTLIWANRSIRDTFLPDEFENILHAMPNLKIHHIMSHQPDYPGMKGYLNETILKELLSPVLHSAMVFLCGPPVMMKLIKYSLRKIGFAKNQIITENFAL